MVSPKKTPSGQSREGVNHNRQTFPSLRRHYPNQVQWVPGVNPPNLSRKQQCQSLRIQHPVYGLCTLKFGSMSSMLIDFHTHIYPDKIASKAAANIGEFYNVTMKHNGTVKSLLESGQRGGIDRYVVFSAAAVPEQVTAINNYIASVCSERREFTGFGTIHKDMENPADEIERLIGLGLQGIKIHPDMQRINIDDDGMMDIYASLEGRLPIIFHSGDYRHSWSHPTRLARVLDRFPRLCVIAAHFGGWSLVDAAYDCFRSRSCFFDVSSSIPYIGKNRAIELIRDYGSERFLFGSDYPMWDPAACVEEFLSLDLSDTENELILHKNARALLGIDKCK
jgi:predicted TIM-barrel fold metal-dependent hydrolase